MALANWQYSFRSVVIGAGTPYVVQTIDGLDMPDVRSGDQTKSSADGDHAGIDTLASRQITMVCEVSPINSTPVTTLLQNLKLAMQPLDPLSQPLESFVYLEPPDPQLTVLCRPRGCHFQKDRMYFRQSTKATLAWYSPYPEIFGDPLSVTLPVFQEAGGFTFPYKFPFTFQGAGVQGQVNATNAGTVETYPVTTIYGYCEGPYIENGLTGEVLALNANLGANDSVVIDHRSHSVTLDGQASLRGAVIPGSSFFSLQPGTTPLRLRTTGVGTGYAVVTWRPAYL